MSRKLLLALAPVLVGIAAGTAILLVNPKAGSRIGDLLYSKSMNAEGYAYAVARAAPSVVNIYVTALNSAYTSQRSDAPQEVKTSASGVIMSSDGYIGTNYHVVPSSNEPDQSIFAMTRDGQLYQAFVIGFAVPSKLVVSVMREIISHGRVIRGYLGISDDGSVPLPDGEPGVGVRIAFIDPSGPAYGILESGDIIFEVNGSRISSLKELIELVSKTAPGASLTFKLYRGGEVLEKSVVLAEDRASID